MSGSDGGHPVGASRERRASGSAIDATQGQECRSRRQRAQLREPPRKTRFSEGRSTFACGERGGHQEKAALLELGTGQLARIVVSPGHQGIRKQRLDVARQEAVRRQVNPIRAQLERQVRAITHEQQLTGLQRQIPERAAQGETRSK